MPLYGECHVCVVTCLSSIYCDICVILHSSPAALGTQAELLTLVHRDIGADALVWWVQLVMA
jgi:hypothetical protein